jgi:ankyrin repeat protein
LLEKGKAHLDDERDSEGRSLLWKAVDTGNTTIVKMLLESGKLDIYRTGNRGWIPLSWASRKGDTAMVRLLLETGKIATSSRVTPLRWARNHGHERVVKLLL